MRITKLLKWFYELSFQYPPNITVECYYQRDFKLAVWVESRDLPPSWIREKCEEFIE